MCDPAHVYIKAGLRCVQRHREREREMGVIVQYNMHDTRFICLQSLAQAYYDDDDDDVGDMAMMK